MEKLISFFQHPITFLTGGISGFFANWGGSVLAVAPVAPWQNWLGAFAEIGGALVVLFSLICGLLAVCSAIGKRIQWMREGQSLFQVLFTDGHIRKKRSVSAFPAATKFAPSGALIRPRKPP